MCLKQELQRGAHRTLVFSQSRTMLDIIQAAVQRRRWPACRIDGSMSADDRAKEVARFRADAAVPLFLLSSQVGYRDAKVANHD